MKPIILGTAGHIDHGKTQLIKALTGIDTDRLKEEKERGITIELGFAFLNLPNGQLLGIVDVPGHEKFVHHMVAGAAGMDLVALVIAADEGVMPQTKEHLEICSLLKVKRGLVVITKIDIVEPEWLELVEEDVKEFLKGTFLEGAPIVKVSSITGEGIPDLIKTLEKLVTEVEPKPSTGLFRLPIDRVFTIKGFGTVVTGTAIGGSVKIGDTLMIYPSEKKTKARNIQVHNKDVSQAFAGQRTAINLQGLEKEEINRGDIIAPPDTLIPSFMLDAFLEILPSAPKSFKNRALVRLHLYTAEIPAQTVILDKDELKPGETGYVQFRLKKPAVALPGDRFVIRSYSPIITLGGGIILHPTPAKHKRMREEVISNLKLLEKGKIEERILAHLKEARYNGLTFKNLQIFLNDFSENLINILENLTKNKKIYLIHKETALYLHAHFVEELEKRIVSFLKEFHQKNPLLHGISKDELKSKFLPFLKEEVFSFLIHHLERKNIIVLEQHLLRLKTHTISLTSKEKTLKEKIYHYLIESGYTPPSPQELAKKLNEKEEKINHLLRLLVEEGKIIRVKEGFYFEKKLIETLKEKLINYLKQKETITPSEFKHLTKASRKYNIPLLEYFDSLKLTIRLGDKRVLRN
ncbi:MAG: selenocysteine-specific translation elongation factor [Candidatus Desulfofervidus auxilii]|nr:selenocysteine-specific translation elongation factor [Candidatus Desulfofervidus auxilii]